MLCMLLFPTIGSIFVAAPSDVCMQEDCNDLLLLAGFQVVKLGF
jgi:hypothetical protein